MIEPEILILKENMKSMLKYSKSEYNKYKSTENIIYLQQAGEKLFNVIENYVGVINNIQIQNFQDALQRTFKEKPLQNLLYDARNLHRFFYNSTNEYTIEKAEEIYKSVLERIENRIKNL